MTSSPWPPFSTEPTSTELLAYQLEVRGALVNREWWDEDSEPRIDMSTGEVTDHLGTTTKPVIKHGR
jgi:hypothetical protein